MMTFHARYADGRLVSVNLGGGDFEPETKISLDFIHQADTRFFVNRPKDIVISIDEGTALYEMVSWAGDWDDVIIARLVSVDRGCDVCRRRQDKHHWWCSRAV